MDIQHIKDYIEISNQIKMLEEKQKELSIAILAEMKETDVKKFMTDFGTFSIFSRSKYIYSDEIQNEIDGLKAKAATLGALNKYKEDTTVEKTETLRFQGTKLNV